MNVCECPARADRFVSADVMADNGSGLRKDDDGWQPDDSRWPI